MPNSIETLTLSPTEPRSFEDRIASECSVIAAAEASLLEDVSRTAENMAEINDTWLEAIYRINAIIDEEAQTFKPDDYMQDLVVEAERFELELVA